jgi:hypothetical protein
VFVSDVHLAILDFVIASDLFLYKCDNLLILIITTIVEFLRRIQRRAYVKEWR